MLIPMRSQSSGERKVYIGTHNRFTWSGLIIYFGDEIRRDGQWFNLLLWCHRFYLCCLHVYIMSWFVRNLERIWVKMKMLILNTPEWTTWRRSSLQSILHFPLRVMSQLVNSGHFPNFHIITSSCAFNPTHKLYTIYVTYM